MSISLASNCVLLFSVSAFLNAVSSGTDSGMGKVLHSVSLPQHRVTLWGTVNSPKTPIFPNQDLIKCVMSALTYVWCLFCFVLFFTGTLSLQLFPGNTESPQWGPQIFVEHLLYANPHARCCGCSGEQKPSRDEDCYKRRILAILFSNSPLWHSFSFK